MRQIFVGYFLQKICVHQIYDVWNFVVTIVSTIFIFAIKIKILKNYQKMLFLPKKYPFVLEIIKFLHFTLSLFFPFAVIADFIEQADWW